MICRKCGTENHEYSSYCKICGAPLPKEEMGEVSKAHKVIGTWTYLGFEILFAIPVVGLVSLLFLALGGTDNENLRNFARAYLCKMLIVVIIVAVLFLTGIISITDLLYL